ncbi:hypothetical protein [Paenibacillus piri]|uniref:Uncharacterized protein n=1 Tax=Paenibacillus piri TaxID=2547395 RepID=A0A4R5KVT9_9BACL|nr:hypothetical protein [Paenibacillus piri]TDG00112.1 hypothetical protein E1757_00195 [Paenibacillus piri]
MICMMVGHSALAAPEMITELSVKISPQSEFESRLTITNNQLFDRFDRKSKRTPAPFIPDTDTVVALKVNGNEVTYRLDREGMLYNEQTNERIELKPKVKAKLVQYAEYLRSVHYGQIVPWEEARALLPKKMKFKVVDIESGLSFNVQRRAGSQHADVQPLTKADTAVMKRIYNGKWSWKRKAILVQAGDRMLAASMHGMPHGGDGIPDNDFSGHFCIHFLGSTTHGSRKVDPEHQLMVFKAGGQLETYFARATPYEIVDAYFNSFSLDHSYLQNISFTNKRHMQLETLMRNPDEITKIRKKLKASKAKTDELTAVEIPVEVGITRKGLREERITVIFQMKRTSVTGPWKIDEIEMIS